MTNRTDQKVMSHLARGTGEFHSIGHGISQWVPTLPATIPISERWNKSLNVAETNIGDLAEWKLILEQPMAPFQKKLYDNYSGKLTLLFLILLGALLLAEILSRRVVITMGERNKKTSGYRITFRLTGKAYPFSSFTVARPSA
jgi:hypothetical protein